MKLRVLHTSAATKSKQAAFAVLHEYETVYFGPYTPGQSGYVVDSEVLHTKWMLARRRDQTFFYGASLRLSSSVMMAKSAGVTSTGELWYWMVDTYCLYYPTRGVTVENIVMSEVKAYIGEIRRERRRLRLLDKTRVAGGVK